MALGTCSMAHAESVSSVSANLKKAVLGEVASSLTAVVVLSLAIVLALEEQIGCVYIVVVVTGIENGYVQIYPGT